jgi:hypothetical protein
MRLWLAKSSEAGYDVRTGMGDDIVFRPYIKDPQVVMMLANTTQMRKRSVAQAPPSLGESVPPTSGQPQPFISN